MKTFVSRLCLLSGIALLCLAVFLVWKRYTPNSLSFATDELPNSRVGNSNIAPRVLVIEGISLKLPIISTELSRGNWPASDRGVSYLTNSGVPGEIGNSIFYGHNWTNLLGNLTRVKEGEKISVLLSDGSQKDFIVRRVDILTPDQTHVLLSRGDKRITIYTCTGLLDTKRFVVTAIAT